MWEELAGLANTLGFLGLLGTLGYQAFIWLETGHWVSLPLLSFLEPPQTTWVGLNQIIYWAYDTNVGVLWWMFAVGAGVLVKGFVAVQRALLPL